jgi:hypothetical protein
MRRGAAPSRVSRIALFWRLEIHDAGPANLASCVSFNAQVEAPNAADRTGAKMREVVHRGGRRAVGDAHRDPSARLGAGLARHGSWWNQAGPWAGEPPTVGAFMPLHDVPKGPRRAASTTDHDCVHDAAYRAMLPPASRWGAWCAAPRCVSIHPDEPPRAAAHPDAPQDHLPAAWRARGIKPGALRLVRALVSCQTQARRCRGAALQESSTRMTRRGAR